MNLYMYNSTWSPFIAYKLHMFMSVCSDAITWSYEYTYSHPLNHNLVVGFLEVFKGVSIVVDRTNHCLRYFVRQDNRTKRFAGICGQPGAQDGNRLLEATFFHPYKIVRDHTRLFFYVSDSGNDAIRKFQLSNINITTLTTSGVKLESPKGLLVDESDTYLYITSLRGIYQLTLETGFVKLLTMTSTRDGFLDGRLEFSRFSYYVEELIALSHESLLVADEGNRRLRMLNLVKRTVTSLCIGKQIHN